MILFGIQAYFCYFWVMVITIKRDATPAQIKRQLAKLKKPKTSLATRQKTLKDYYGSLKRGIDGLAYQKEMRDED